MGTWERYGVSKLSNILFSVALDEKLKDQKVYVNACHPGGKLSLCKGGVRWKLPLVLCNLVFMNSENADLNTKSLAVATELMRGPIETYGSWAKPVWNLLGSLIAVKPDFGALTQVNLLFESVNQIECLLQNRNSLLL